MKLIGLDLAGSPSRPSGICVVEGRKVVFVSCVFSDDEIFRVIFEHPNSIVLVDAPLSLPRGRKNIDRRSSHHLRECDRYLLERKIRFIPVSLGPMRLLTKRGMRLADALRKKGYSVFEVFPGATYDVFGVPRKDKERILRFLSSFFELPARSYTQDELDAITCALAGFLWRRGKGRFVGDIAEGVMLVVEP